MTQTKTTVDLPETHLQTTKERNPKITLVDDSSTDTCQFWVSLFRRGSLNPKSILNKKTLLECFVDASQNGVSSNDSLLFSVNLESCQQTLYMENFENISFEKLSCDVQKCSPKSLGFYIDQNLYENEDHYSQNLEELLTVFIRNTSYNNYYVLKGSTPLNCLLQTGSRVKKRLFKDFDLNLQLLH